MEVKNKFVAKIFAAQKEDFLNSKEFLTWKAENKHWLLPYVIFTHLRDVYKTIDYTQWKKEEQHMSMVRNERVSSFYGFPLTALSLGQH